MGLSRAPVAPRLLIGDRVQVLADLVAAIVGGAEVISDVRGWPTSKSCWARSPRCRPPGGR